MSPRPFLVALAAIFALADASASEPAMAVPLWPDRPPGETAELEPERDMTRDSDQQIAGRRVIRLGNVSNPVLQVFRPAANDTGTSVLVCPGGGYHILALDLEGTEVCEWLNSIGVTGILLKYRVPRRSGVEKHVPALQDAQRAMSLLRSDPRRFGVNPDRIGALGFSAGAHLVAALSTVTERSYPAVDEADKAPTVPNFAVLVYPGYLVNGDDHAVSPELSVTSSTPPTFLVMSQDDPVRPENALYYAAELMRKRVPMELHIYPSGGHGFGLRRTENPVTAWPDRAADWLRAGGWLARSDVAGRSP